MISLPVADATKAPTEPVVRPVPAPRIFDGTQRSKLPPIQHRRVRPGRHHPGKSRRVALAPVLAYYAAVLGLAALLGSLFPFVREAMVSLETARPGSPLDVLIGGTPSAPGTVPPFLSLVNRGLSTAIVSLGALLLVLPVAWIYMRTKRLRYDPSLVQSVIVLPIVVAGILMVAKNSIAVAFGVVGIVAAVRFRNNLSDPRDAVYIFLALAIGVAAGVQALDVALVTSLTFNLLILALWHYDVGSIYGGSYGRTGVLSLGDGHLMVARAAESRRRLRAELRRSAEKVGADGLLLIHTSEIRSARRGVEELLAQRAKKWRLAEIVLREEGYSTLEYLVRLKRKSEPIELVTALDEHGSAQIDAVEYVPLTGIE